MKREYFLSLCLLLIGFASTAAYSETTSIRRHSTGLKKSTPAQLSFMSNKVMKLTSVQPNNFAFSRYSKAMASNRGITGVSDSAVINLQYLPPTGNQGQLGSCSAWASCYYVKTYEEAQEHGWTDIAANRAHQMSPAFGYNLADDGINAGSDPGFIMQLMCDHGCTTMTDMPVTANTTDYTSWPTASMWKSAISYRGDKAAIIDLSTSEGITNLKQWIANGNIAVVGVEAYTNLECYPSSDTYSHDSTVTISTNNVLYANPGIAFYFDGQVHSTDLGGHAMTVIGYDDTRTFLNNVTGHEESGAFLVLNQWGTDWGINISTYSLGYTDTSTGNFIRYAVDTSTGGFIWMSYNYLQNLSTYQQAYVMTDRIGYTPTTYGSFTINHRSRGCLDIDFRGGTSDTAPDWRFNCLPYLGGDVPINQKIYVDLTPYTVDYTKSFWLGVFDSSSTNTSTGQITGMSVIRPDGTEFTSAGVPVSTVKDSTIYVDLNPLGLASLINLSLPSGPVSVNIPAYCFTTPVTVLVTSTTAPSTASSDLIFTGLAISVDSGGNQPAKLVTITMYDNDLPASINKTRLAIAYYDSALNRWVPLSSTLGPNANQISCQASRLSCVFALVELVPSSSLASVKAYPNPYRINSISSGITIANLTQTSDIKIYNVAGELVRTLDYSNGSGRATWDARNDSGNLVGSGVYIIYVHSAEGTQMLKVAVEK